MHHRGLTVTEVSADWRCHGGPGAACPQGDSIVTAPRTKAVSLAGSPATHPQQQRPERARDPRGDRYNHSLAFDPRTSLSTAARRRGPVEVGTVAVSDPLSPGKRLVAAANRNVDVLEMERSHGRITVSQYEVGRQVQAILELGSGARLGSAGWEVRGTKDLSIAHELAIIHAVDDARLVAKLKDKVVRAVGAPGARFLGEVLTGRQTFAQFAAARGKAGERGTAYIAEHFRILMENLDEDFAAEGVESAVQGFTGERTGEETDARGKLVPAGHGHAWGTSEARYAPQMSDEARALAGRTARVRDRVAVRRRVAGEV